MITKTWQKLPKHFSKENKDALVRDEVHLAHTGKLQVKRTCLCHDTRHLIPKQN